jgi:two-component system response regulator AtoC
MATIKAFKIIVVEPNSNRRNYLRMQISDSGDTAVCFEKESSCLDNLALLEPDLVIIGQLPIERVSRFLYAAKYIDIWLPVLVISAEPATHSFIGVNGFPDTIGVSPAITPETLSETIGQFKERANNISNRKGAHDWPMIVGADPELVKLKKAIFEIARANEALLVEGECGTGKDLVARAVHFWSTRDQGAFIKIDSGAITREILQNGLSMGFVSREETCRQAQEDKTHPLDPSRQTLFFDEIGQMPIPLQGILLRLFEQQGEAGNEIYSVSPHIRIIASTCENLAELVSAGKFRKDLFYRLTVFRIRIPPLRNRPGDVPLLVDFFIDKYCRQLGKGHYSLPRKSRARYAEYDWPGNVRELENIVKSSVVVGDENGYIESLCRCYNRRKKGAVLEQEEPFYPLVDAVEIKSYLENLNGVSLKDICSEFIMRAEKKFMKNALNRTNWNRKKAAGLLNISYKSLLNKIKVYNLTA